MSRKNCKHLVHINQTNYFTNPNLQFDKGLYGTLYVALKLQPSDTDIVLANNNFFLKEN